MIEFISVGLEDRVLGLRIRGRIERTDLEAVTLALEDKLTRHERVRVYAEVDDLGGISPSALLADLRLGVRHYRDVDREAVVTDASWMAALAKAGNLLPGIEVRAFETKDKASAQAWING